MCSRPASELPLLNGTITRSRMSRASLESGNGSDGTYALSRTSTSPQRDGSVPPPTPVCPRDPLSARSCAQRSASRLPPNVEQLPVLPALDVTRGLGGAWAIRPCLRELVGDKIAEELGEQLPRAAGAGRHRRAGQDYANLVATATTGVRDPGGLSSYSVPYRAPTCRCGAVPSAWMYEAEGSPAASASINLGRRRHGYKPPREMTCA
jgi:hypothetical protein